jgi:toxin ParE1/3/4
MIEKAYRISEKAALDLEEIWLYTFENWSEKQADRYFDLIMDEIEYLSTHVEAGKSISNIIEGYRVSKVKSHLVFYKESTDTVIEVIRILHERMDIENRLKE